MSTAVGTVKRCCKCGKDVTGGKRFKDAKGHYWCEGCGSPEMAAAAAKSESLINPCPKCHKPTHVAHLVRKNGIYMCEHCATGTKRTDGAAAPGDEAAAKQKKMLILGGGLLVAGAAIYYFMNMMG